MKDPMIQTQIQEQELFEPALPDNPQTTASVSEEQQHRAAVYNLLAAMLRQSPDAALLEHVAGFARIESEDDEFSIAMTMLGLSAAGSDVESVDDEFHALFIGLGRGELVPYGAWYQTGYLMERPLGILRDDLKAMGFQRDDSVREPEDHVAALCEVMSLLILDNASHALQADFFSKHMGSWFERFFTDLSQAGSADFYKAVGRFGLAFTDFENQYLSMQV